MQESVFDFKGAALNGRYRLISLMEFLMLGIILFAVSIFLQVKYSIEDSATLYFASYYMKSYLPVMWCVLALYRFFADKKRAYWLSPKDVSYRVGWLTPTVVTLPVKRLQHVEIKQGALDRLFKLYRVTVLSAGRGFTIPGLNQDEAESLREALLEFVVSEDGE